MAEDSKTSFPMMPKFPADFDFTKMFGEIRLPEMPDMDAVLAVYKRNLEAVSDANRVALEGAEAVARRHMEIMQATMSELTSTMRQITASDTPASRAARQTDLMKHAYENAVSNTRELGDLIQRSSIEAMQRLNNRFSEAMTEMKALIKKP